MRLNLILPHVEPDAFELPKTCPRKGCCGRRFVLRRRVRKNKERYRTMRGYKWEASALGVSRLMALAGNHLDRGLRLADLMA